MGGSLSPLTAERKTEPMPTAQPARIKGAAEGPLYPPEMLQLAWLYRDQLHQQLKTAV